MQESRLQEKIILLFRTSIKFITSRCSYFPYGLRLYSSLPVKKFFSLSGSSSDSASLLFQSIFLKFLTLVVVAEAIVRIVFLCNIATPEGTCFGVCDYLQSFALGLVNDVCVATIAFIPLWLFCITITPKKHNKTAGLIILGALVATLIYIYFLDNQLHQFNGPLTRIICIILLIWIVSFATRFFLPRVRKRWTQVSMALLITIYVVLTVFNCIAEYFFWAEFNVRYNFIAVDYLIYTQEVIGNIFESYSMIPIILLLILFSAAIIWLFFRKCIVDAPLLNNKGWRLRISAIYVPITVLAAILLNFNTRFQQTDNTYLNELQANGVYKFYQAFLANRLEFDKFYSTLPTAETEKNIMEIYGDFPRHIAADTTINTSHPNVFLITVESLSADYLARYGNSRNLTPNIDSIAAHSLTFDRAFATGNRTVRGLEAVTLSLPPSPGQSIVKRDNNVYPSTADIFRENGYDAFFFYGGNAYFDNMESFFTGNGYKVIDRNSYQPQEVTLETVWGVCDEDGFNKVITTMNQRFKTNSKPVFAHIMTISNHRPFIYPEGKVSIPSAKKKRDGGVQYTDYAVGKFVKEARHHSWGKDAIFVIVADHCASSAGQTDLPLGNYHIPAMIYSPERITAQSIDKIVSQIDIMPTLFGILNFGYLSNFYGTDVLSADYTPRAFMATYQDLGYLEGDTLTVLSPLRRIRQFVVTPTDTDPFHTVATHNISSRASQRATALYQSAASTH